MYDVASKNSRDPSRTQRGELIPTGSGGAHMRQFVVEAVADRIAAKVHANNNAKTKAKTKARVVDKLAASAERQVTKLNEVVEKAGRGVDKLERLGAHLDALDVWTRPEPGSRKPRFTREEIAAVAVRIADREGLAALSMRRLAAELDAGTMTLYHYVRTKDELLSLVVDEVMSNVLVEDGAMPTDWREAMMLIANRSRASLMKHPWILDITGDFKLGPNSVRHFDQSLQAVSSLRVSLTDRLDILTTVDEFVFGHCMHARSSFTYMETNDTARTDDVETYVNDLLTTGYYPQLAAIIEDVGIKHAWSQIEAHSNDAGRFNRNLARILNGMSADLQGRRNSSPSTREKGAK